jgi:2-polyprenyl-3-methyl-5-hydroxy-6-metoxy-1,4-benzoquinol methylase
MKVDVCEGLFPGVQLPTCDLFLAFDVMEHVSDPKNFICAVRALMHPGGVAIIQTPIERYDYEHPFKMRPDFFDDLEHLLLFTDKAILTLATLAQLEMVNLEDSLGSLGQICVLRKSA